MVRLADRILKTDNGPLLPDHDQLKYPPGLPTLVFDPEKVLMQRVYDVRASFRFDAASDWMENQQTSRSRRLLEEGHALVRAGCLDQ